VITKPIRSEVIDLVPVSVTSERIVYMSPLEASAQAILQLADVAAAHPLEAAVVLLNGLGCAWLWHESRH
jgi:hypothetical protein